METKHIFLALITTSIAVGLLNMYLTLRVSGKFDSIAGNAGNEIAEVAGMPQGSGSEGESRQAAAISADGDPSKGSSNAPVIIIEFSDFQCPFCAKFYFETLPLIQENYINTGKARLVYRDFPLSGHKNAHKAAEAAECADEQGNFWEYHDVLFNNQGSLGTDSLKQYASELGLDMAKFNDCLDSGKMSAEVDNDFGDGISYGVSGTPAFFINGKMLVGAQPYSVFEQAIESELAR